MITKVRVPNSKQRICKLKFKLALAFTSYSTDHEACSRACICSYHDNQ